MIPAGIGPVNGRPSNPMAAMKKRLALSEANAKKLTQIGMSVRLFDARTDVVALTTSLPWTLAHGEWVVKVNGKSGGWSCANLEVIESEVEE